MHEQVHYQPIALILLITFIGLSVLAIGLFRRERWNKIRLVFGFMVSAVSIWALGDFLQMVTPQKFADIWALVRFLGICPVGALWLLLAFLYTGGPWAVIRRYLPLLFLPVVVSYSFLLTNPWHHLFFSASLSRFLENQVFGPAYWFHAIISYLYIITGIFLYVSSYFRTSEKIYQKQTLIMIMGCLVPLFGNALFIFQLVSLPADITPLLFSITVILYGIGIFRLALADLRPIAMDTILSNLRSGILIVDHSGYVVGTNPYFFELFDLRQDIVGTSADELVELLIPGVQEPQKFRSWVQELLKGNHHETHFSLELSTEERAIELTYSPIYEEHRQQLGGIMVLHDVTEWKKLNRSLEEDRRELAKKNEEFFRINEELRKKNEELERFNRFAVSREMKMIELKRRLKDFEQSK